MINYEVKNSPAETVLFLQDFEKDLGQEVNSICKKEDYKRLKVQLYLILKESDDDNPYSVESNATLSLPFSNAFVSEIDKYASKRRVEFNSCLPSRQHLVIRLVFEEKKVEESGVNETDLTFIPITPRYTYEQVILPDELKQEIEDCLSIISNKDLVYKEWGFEKVDPIPKSVLNFYGPPGTGKTMMAHAIANKLNKKLLALNYAEIESKYVGEAPKNLMKAFDTAKQMDCVLFFDEADSFLGKRITNVTQGADQALNSLRSQMLMLLEEYSGVVIFATNLVTNFDKAFESRILKHLKFDLPNHDARKAIIKSMIPHEVPLEHPVTDDELSVLSDSADGFAGREIKNAILEVLLSGANLYGKDALFTVSMFKDAFIRRKEMLKSLKDEKNAEKKEKIMKALAKPGALSSIETNNTNEDKNTSDTNQS